MSAWNEIGGRNGYAKLPFRVYDAFTGKPWYYREVLLYLIRHANLSPHGGMDRGQVCTSAPEIAKALGWHAGKSPRGPTEKAVRDALDWLSGRKSDESRYLEITKVTHGIIVTICDFDNYQGHLRNESQD